MTDLWTALDRIIIAAPDATALRTHGLGPIAAWRLRQRGELVPPGIERLAMGAAYASVTATPLLQKVVDILQEPVLVLKGPEVAQLYSERTLRTYGDLYRQKLGRNASGARRLGRPASRNLHG